MWLGVSLGDLKRLAPCFENLDGKHAYERLIYEAYLANGSFTLTDEQREKAYKEYKEAN